MPSHLGRQPAARLTSLGIRGAALASEVILILDCGKSVVEAQLMRVAASPGRQEPLTVSRNVRKGSRSEPGAWQSRPIRCASGWRTAPHGCVTWAVTQATPLRAKRIAPASRRWHEASQQRRQQRASRTIERSSKSVYRVYFEMIAGSDTGAVLRVEVHPTPRWVGCGRGARKIVPGADEVLADALNTNGRPFSASNDDGPLTERLS
jgi:hypothetical protein